MEVIEQDDDLTLLYWPMELILNDEVGYKRISLLKSCFKFLLHAWQSTGTGDRLRPFIDSSLPKSILTIFNSINCYGHSLFAISIFLFFFFLKVFHLSSTKKKKFSCLPSLNYYSQ